jgi:hypothetical protein
MLIIVSSNTRALTEQFGWIRLMEKLEGTRGGALDSAAVENFLIASAEAAWIVKAEVSMLRERLENRFSDNQLMLRRCAP